MTKKVWNLYVDESGRIPMNPYDPPAYPDECVVAGVLVPEDSALNEAATLRARIKSQVPWMPWPLHNSHFKVPVIHLAWILNRAGSKDLTPFEIWSLPMAVWLVANDHRFARFCAEMSVLESYDANEVERYRSQLEQEFGTRWAGFEAGIALLRGTVPRTIAGHFDALDTELHLYASGESARGDCWADPDCDAWQALFDGMVARLVDSFALRPGEHLVRVRCADRFVWNDVVSRWSPMTTPFVQNAIKSSLRVPSLRTRPRVEFSKAGVSVEIQAEKPVNYKRDADAFLVMADVAANSARDSLLAASPWDLASISDSVFREVPYATSLSDEPIPALAAIGNAASHIDSHRDTDRATIPLNVPVRRPWIEEQANLMTAACAAHPLDWR